MSEKKLVAAGCPTWSLYPADGPGRVVANVRDYRADAWMRKVIR